MTRSGYSDDFDHWTTIRWRGAVASALRGKRGQKLIRDLIAALDALPEPRLIANSLQCADGVCALGSVGLLRGLDLGGIDPDDANTVAGKFGIAHSLAREVMFENDEAGRYEETPDQRWTRIRAWAVASLKVPS